MYIGRAWFEGGLEGEKRPLLDCLCGRAVVRSWACPLQTRLFYIRAYLLVNKNQNLVNERLLTLASSYARFSHQNRLYQYDELVKRTAVYVVDTWCSPADPATKRLA